MSSMDDEERPESDIRKRAAWLLAMLAVVAGLFVLLSVTLFDTSGGGGTDHGDIADPPADISTPAPDPSAGTSGSGATPASSSSSPAARATTTGAVPKPSCPGPSTCTVHGDVAGTMSAVNALRARNGKKAVPVTSTGQADTCALSSGDDCPSSFVWVRVKDLSGSGVVKGVTGFNSDDDLLDDSATSFEVGWAYDPGSKSLSCAVIRND